MALKRTGQLDLGEALVPAERGRNAALERVDGLIRWEPFERQLAGFGDEGPGRPGYAPLILFKALLLQAWHGLSDRELEALLGDRMSFGRFVGLSLSDAVPDHTVLCRFRNKLVRAGVLERLFGELDAQLEAAGLVLKKGTMLDATLIEAAAARRGRGEASADPEAAYAGRAGKPGAAFGYKAHMGVDQGSGLIRAVLTTPANVNDTVPADALIRGDEAAVLGDAAYHTHRRAAELKARGIKARLMRRPNKHHPLLPPRLKRLNRLIARQRWAVETTFATLKRRMRLARTRYFGLAKVAGQMLMAAMAFNLRRLAILAV